MKKILVRADDLGFSEGVNYGIEKSVKQGIVKTVGIMVNMEATVHGWNLLKDTDTCFGLHTNICVGRPISDPSKIPSLVDENGEFKSSKTYRSAKEDFVNLDEVIVEIEAQYNRFVELTGQKPDYFEGHAVKSKNFFLGLEKVANADDCDYLKINFGKEPCMYKSSKLYISMDSMFENYDPYRSFKKSALTEYPDGYCMFVCHPGYLDAYLLEKSSLTFPRVQEVKMLCDPDIKEWIYSNRIQVISYKDLG